MELSVSQEKKIWVNRLFPVYYTLIMVICNMASSITDVTVTPLHEYYQGKVSWFQLNLVNFIPSFVYLPIALLIPTHRMVKWQLVLVFCTCTFFGILLQSWYSKSYACLVIGSIIQSTIPPFVMANLLSVASQYFSAKNQGLMIGWFTAINNFTSCCVYLVAFQYIRSSQSIEQYFGDFNLLLIAILFIGSIICLVPYFGYTESREWDQALAPFASEKQDQKPIFLPKAESRKWVFGIYFIVFGLLTSASNVLDSILSQLLLKQTDMSNNLQLLAILLYIMPSVPGSILIGWCADKMSDQNIPLWILPLLTTIGQCVSQVGVFYSETSTQLLICLSLFSIANGAMTVVFLPTLLRLHSATVVEKQGAQLETVINRWLLIWSTLCSAVGVFMLLTPNSDVSIFGIYMNVVSSIVFVLISVAPCCM